MKEKALCSTETMRVAVAAAVIATSIPVERGLHHFHHQPPQQMYVHAYIPVHITLFVDTTFVVKVVSTNSIKTLS